MHPLTFFLIARIARFWLAHMVMGIFSGSSWYMKYHHHGNIFDRYDEEDSSSSAANMDHLKQASKVVKSASNLLVKELPKQTYAPVSQSLHKPLPQVQHIIVLHTMSIC